MGSVDLVDFVFKGLTNQRNIRYENRPGQGAYQMAQPEFEIGTAAAPTMDVSDIGVAVRLGNVGIGTTTPQGGLVVTNGNVGIGTWITPGGSLIVQVGNVGIGTITPGSKLDVFGSARVLNGGSLTVAGLVSCAGVQTSAAGLMSCTSDVRLKDIHGSFDEGLSAISKINPQTYSWKKDSYLYDGGVRYSGFIAQDVEKALPEAVNIGGEGYKQVSTTPILAAAVNAIKELDKKFEDMQKRNDEEGREINALQKQVEELEKKLNGGLMVTSTIK